MNWKAMHMRKAGTGPADSHRGSNLTGRNAVPETFCFGVGCGFQMRQSLRSGPV